MSALRCVFLQIGLIGFAGAVEIDNGIMGNPIVECGAEDLTIRIGTRKPFTGRLFVKGRSSEDACLSDHSLDGPIATNKEASITVSLGECEMKRQRMADRAFNVKCFYMIAEKVLTQSLEVSMLSTSSLSDSGTVPECSYSVHEASVRGPLVRFARVGQKLFHVWKCDTEGRMGMLVRNCVVESGGGRSFAALREDGCPTDRHIMPALTYNPESLAEAFVETHAFKFADDVNVFFKCEISLCHRDDENCDGLTPPQNCEMLPTDEIPRGRLILNRTRRAVPGRRSSSLLPPAELSPSGLPILEVRPSNDFVVLDPEAESDGGDFGDAHSMDGLVVSRVPAKVALDMDFCRLMSSVPSIAYILAAFAVILGLTVFLAVILIVMVCLKQAGKSDKLAV